MQVQKKDGFDVFHELSNKPAFCFKSFFTPQECAEISKTVYAARQDWSSGFDGLQYSLGEAWYHYAEEGIDFEDYSLKADKARATVEKHLPGLEFRVLDLLSSIVGSGQVSVRSGWAGPGIMIFPAGSYVAQNGGSVHFDTDAFSDEELSDPALEMYSFVCMLQKPESGGNLRIWKAAFDPAGDREQSFDPDEHPDVPFFDVTYELGDLWMFGGMNAHRIGSFEGSGDRICLTFHMYRRGQDWHVWF